jgi:hypothetical protein
VYELRRWNTSSDIKGTKMRGVPNALSSYAAGHVAEPLKIVANAKRAPSRFRKNVAAHLQRGRCPDREPHLALTRVAAIDSDSCVASLRQRLNRCDVHFAAALTGGAFRTAGLQQSFKHA